MLNWEETVIQLRQFEGENNSLATSDNVAGNQICPEDIINPGFKPSFVHFTALFCIHHKFNNMCK